MNDQSLKDTAGEILEKTIKRGIKDVIVRIAHKHKTKVIYRQGKIDELEEVTSRNISLEFFDFGKYGTFSLNDFSTEAIDSFLDSAVVMTRAMEADPFREITNPEFYGGRKNCDLDLYHREIAELSIDRIKETARDIEASARLEAGDLAASTDGLMQTGVSFEYAIHSNGFEGELKETDLWVGAGVSLKDDNGKRPSDGIFEAGRCLDDVRLADQIGCESVERARMKLGAKKQATCRTIMILENRAVGGFLRNMVQAMCGWAIQQKNSFFTLDDRGNTIGSSLLTLKDDPFVPRGWGSRLFDKDGISAKAFTLIDHGKLENFFIDYYYSKKLKTIPTTGRYSNLFVESGQNSLEQMIENTKEGILVRGFLGGNCNPTTGDFSFGISGTKIEKGKLTLPVTEMNVSGNFRDFWQKLTALGSDVWPYSNPRSPSLKFSDVQFSGL